MLYVLHVELNVHFNHYFFISFISLNSLFTIYAISFAQLEIPQVISEEIKNNNDIHLKYIYIYLYFNRAIT